MQCSVKMTSFSQDPILLCITDIHTPLHWIFTLHFIVYQAGMHLYVYLQASMPASKPNMLMQKTTRLTIKPCNCLFDYMQNLLGDSFHVFWSFVSSSGFATVNE